MNRPTGVFKSDAHAKRHWDADVYSAIPKSVFATVCWHLANVASGEADNPGAAEGRFLEELRALGQQEIIPKTQMETTVSALVKALAKY